MGVARERHRRSGARPRGRAPPHLVSREYRRPPRNRPPFWYYSFSAPHFRHFSRARSPWSFHRTGVARATARLAPPAARGALGRGRVDGRAAHARRVLFPRAAPGGGGGDGSRGGAARRRARRGAMPPVDVRAGGVRARRGQAPRVAAACCFAVDQAHGPGSYATLRGGEGALDYLSSSNPPEPIGALRA